MRRREFLGAAASPLAQPDAKARDRPNFLILLSDQHSPHVLGCRGDKVVKTPNLDALAQTGILFESAYCQSPVCVPSRMSFLTGQQPSKNRVWTNNDTLPSDIPTFAHALGAAGYETLLIGRMHFLGKDQNHGFEKRLVGSITPMYAHIPQTLPQHLLVGAQGNSLAAVRTAGPGKTSYQAYDDEVTTATVGFLRKRAREQGRPFCVVAGFVLPHAPYICRKQDWDYYYGRVTLPQAPPAYYENLHPAIKTWRKSRAIEDLSPEEIRKARTGYYGLVTHFDRLVGQIMNALEETGLRQNTVVIYTSDHGDMAGENGMWWKNSFYEGSVSVPLIASFPPRFRPGRRVREVVSLIDIGPTTIDLAGADKLPSATGQSLVPLLEGRAESWPDEAFSEYPSTHGVPITRMIRRGRWKLVHYDGQRPQLFDLETDPHEFHDLGESLAHAEIRGRLQERVLSGWSAEEMRRELARRAADQAVLRKWSEKVQPPTPEQWRAPKDANVFPEQD